MGNPDENREDEQRIWVSKATAERVKKLFPDATYDQAIGWLIDRHGQGVMDTAACANTELWLKVDLLESVLELLSVSNIEIADIYRRRASGELEKLRQASVRVAVVAESIEQKG